MRRLTAEVAIASGLGAGMLRCGGRLDGKLKVWKMGAGVGGGVAVWE